MSKTPVKQNTVCPICGGPVQSAFEALGYSLSDCVGCVHRFADFQPTSQHVENIYGDDYFCGGGSGYANYLKGADLLVASGERYGKLANQHVGNQGQPGLMLDVGAAAGFLMKGFSNQGWAPHGLEPNAMMAETGEEKFGFPMHVGTLEAFKSEEAFDLIAMIQVIAHFHELNAAMDNAQRLTRPGGLWLIETWNHRSLTARAFGKHWHEYSPPSVLQMFSIHSLTELAKRHGMKFVAQGRPKKYIMGGHAKSLLRYRLQQSAVGRMLDPITRILPDKLQIPYPSEDLFWAMFRKPA